MQNPELARFLDADGRLSRWPSKRRVRDEALHYLAAQFERNRHYSEREVNSLLDRWHTFRDPATLRRTLFDEGYLDRTVDGRYYWRRPE